MKQIIRNDIKKISKGEMLRRRKITTSVLTILFLSAMIIIPYIYGQTRPCVNIEFIILYVCTLVLGAMSSFKESMLLLVLTIIQSGILVSCIVF